MKCPNCKHPLHIVYTAATLGLGRSKMSQETMLYRKAKEANSRTIELIRKMIETKAPHWQMAEMLNMGENRVTELIGGGEL